MADRGFPSLKLFGCLEYCRKHLPSDHTIRLRAGDSVHLADGRNIRLSDLLQLLAVSTDGNDG